MDQCLLVVPVVPNRGLLCVVPKLNPEVEAAGVEPNNPPVWVAPPKVIPLADPPFLLAA